jgi:hypothetical protein
MMQLKVQAGPLKGLRAICGSAPDLCEIVFASAGAFY